jgi:hypothetical protein
MLSLTPVIRDSAVGVMSRLGAGNPRSSGSIPGADKVFYIQGIQTDAGVHLPSYLMVIGKFVLRGQSGRTVNLSIHYDLGPSLTISGTVPVFLPMPLLLSQGRLYQVTQSLRHRTAR